MRKMEPIYTFRIDPHFVQGKWIEGKTLKIYPDDNPIDPREWGNLGKMVCFSHHYNLGDKHDIDPDDFNSWEEIADYLESELGAVIILPLYLYDHSGLRMSVGSFNDPWDSGQCGFIYIDYHTMNKEYGNTLQSNIELATKVLIAEVEEYDKYLSGDVYGYEVEDVEGNFIDSCWGFYDLDYLLEEQGFSWRDEI